MSNGFTYEEKNTNTSLEKYEWDNVWWDNTGDTKTKRVLYIGDSISFATREVLNQTAEGMVRVDGFATSKGIDNPYFKDALKLFMKQELKRNIVLFNNGLHGWHLSTEEYKKYYEEMIKFLLDELDDTQLFVLTSTSVENKERDMLVAERNKEVNEIAEKYGLSVIDLYSVSKNIKWRDGVHFTDEGYLELAKYILEFIG